MQIVDSAVRAYAGLSPSRAAAAALDAIEHGGAAVFAWRDRFEQLAHEARAPRILVELAERILALSPCDDAAALLAATDAHLYASDMDGAAHALVRAVAAGATPDDVLRRLEQLTPLSGDGRLDATTARAMALTAAGLAQEASDQWLRVGALRWDLGDNTVGAIDAWCTALRGTDARSLGRVAGLAALFAGAELASEALRNHALLHPSLSTSTGALVAAAALAIAAGKPATANEMALQAIERDPRRTDALVVAERASDVLGDPGAADSAYVAVARGAKGRFGKRAAHYRAARTLEQRGMYDLAVVHAIAAFETDPAPGSALALMVRIASHVDPGEVIATLRGVAGAAEGPEARAYWLLQAAGAAKQDHAHLQTALDLGLGALVASPDSGAALLIWDVALRLLANDPSDRDVLEVRLQRALRAVAPRLEGPRGARVALSLARFCVEVLEAPSLAIAWAEAALSTSGDIDEYDQLTGFAPSLAQDFDRAAAFVDTVIHHAASMSGTVGPALYALAEAMARALGDPGRADAVAHACAKHNQDAHAEQEYVDPFADLTDTPATASQQDAPEKQDDTCAEHRAESHTVPGIGPSPVGRVASVLAQGILWEALRLEREGDPQAAIDLLARAHDREPAHQASFDEVLRRLYLATGRTWELEQLLDRCNARSTSATEKVGLLLELVELAEARSDASAVRLRWLQLAELDPNHHDAAKFLEDDALDRGDFEGLVELLRRRAQAAGSVRQLRALLARRAVILTDELGRSAQATREIDALLEEHGDDPELLLLRARIEEQDRGAVCAAPYLLRAAQLTVPRGDAESLCIRAAWAYLDVNDVRGASHAISLVSGSHSPDVLHVLVAIEQRGGNPEVLGTLLDELATGSTQSADQKALWLVQAAGAALQAGQTGAALERASRAIELAPNDPHVQLRAVFVGYRADGLGDDGSVQTMLRRLQNVADRIGTSDIPLHAYLVAEAVERLQSPQAAIDYLNSRRRVAGLAPLIALGLADRLAAAGDAEAAIPYFQIALKSDDLQGVRSKTQVAFQAARAALRVGGRIAAAPFIEQVETDPGAQELAERLQAELAEIAPPAEEMQRQLDQIARAARRSERAQALLQLARLSAGRRTRGADAQADSFFAEALSAAATDEALRAQILRERDAFRATLAPSQAPLPVPLGAGPSSVPPLPPSTQFTQALAPELRAARAASTAPPQPPRDVSSHPPAGPATRMLSRAGGFVSDRPAAHPHHSPVSESNEERALFAQLAGGDLDAGDTLAEMLARHTERAHDLVAVRRRQVVHAPHDTRLLALLGEAADADLNRPLARAVQHVVGVLTGKPTVAPPPVSSQAGDPERMLAMTVRGVHGCAAEVLGNVWTHASHLFVRDPAAYGLTGVERVALSSPSNLGHAYASAARALGLARTPLFYRRTTGSPQLAIAMLSPIAVVASGDFRDERNVLAYRVAFMLAAATPANGMLFGMPPNAIRQLLQALVAAFGPPEASRGKQGETAVLAGELWRALPGRVQRRVHEAFRDPTPPAYEDAWARGLQSSRRAGLLVVGDLAVALRDVMEDPGLRGLVDVGAPDAFLSVCKQSGSAADLVRFATSAEYAEARWRDDVGRRTSSPDLR
ncbi:MAG: tetratricopeptide repeat protein [Polyangiaceae bacterium]|nr:tetratricopeptide repeat protein [Polyangiaceae bacterium]